MVNNGLFTHTHTHTHFQSAFYSLGYYTRLADHYDNHHHTRSTNKNTTTNHLPTLYLITPTHTRPTQKVDLTSMCHTLMHVEKLHWIVIEDSNQRTELVANLLKRCDVQSTHLVTRRSKILDVAFAKYWRGVEQRNLGLNWLRSQCGAGSQSLLTTPILQPDSCSGVVYFADDDNKYDLRLFKVVRVRLYKTLNS